MATRTIFQESHVNALKLELSLVGKLLKRHRSSHGKAKYYRLLSMAYRSMLQTRLLVELYAEVKTLQEEIPRVCAALKKKRKRDEIEWQAPMEKERPSQSQVFAETLYQRLEQTGSCTFEKLPECVSRLEHAANSFLTEISRGFFLPFCTVAIACIARIRAILLRLESFVIHDCGPGLKKIEGDLRKHVSGNTVLESIWSNYDDKQHCQASNSNEVLDILQISSKKVRAAAVLDSLGLSTYSVASTDVGKNDCKLEVVPKYCEGSSGKVGPVDALASASLDAGEKVLPSLDLETGVYETRQSNRESVGDKINSTKPPQSKTETRLKKKKRKKATASEPAKNGKKEKSKKGDFFDDLFSR